VNKKKEEATREQDKNEASQPVLLPARHVSRKRRDFRNGNGTAECLPGQSACHDQAQQSDRPVRQRGKYFSRGITALIREGLGWSEDESDDSQDDANHFRNSLLSEIGSNGPLYADDYLIQLKRKRVCEAVHILWGCSFRTGCGAAVPQR
jgi:hypothetical protein